ncbi:DDE-3 multi-domain protein [Pyrenophora tritici-repentis]|nr:DDE-3 multi-domain protein [Pyrenophora tritici-repentis]
MTINQNQRDATVILTDSSKWIPWYRQIKMQCEALEIWDIVDPAGNTQPRTKPTEPLPPLVSDYEPAAALRNTSSAPSSSTRTARANARAPTQDTVDIVNPAVQTPAIPARYSELSAEGKEAYDGDSREFKMVFESYKIRERNYRDERTNIAAMIRHLNATVSPHLQVSCFEEHGTLRTWITNLQVAVGVDLDDEIRRVRERYHDSLRPMRSPQNWESWLSEYDQAATRAEALKIGDVIQSKLVVDDFLKAVSKIAPAWMATFTGAGSDRNNIERRQMMKLFREHMSLAHPTRGKSRSAFMTGEAAYAASGESDSNTQGDASSVQIRAPSTNPSQGNQRQTNKRKMNAPGNKSKQFQKRNTAEAGDICPAYGREISRLDEGMMKAAFNASNQGYPLKDAFILDSGSTTHICNNLSRLEDVRPPAMGDYIWAGNSRVWIQGYGAVKVTAEGAQGKQILHLSNVAWCPDFLCSLVSFRLLRRQGIWWDNRGDPTSLRRWDGSTIATLSEHYGQWVIEPPTTSTSAFHVRMNRAKRSPQKATAILWHKRLGHPGPSAIEHLVQQSEGVRIKGITTVECDACGRSKSKRQIRRTPRLNDEGPGERVAIDFHEYEDGSFTKEKSQMLITCRRSRYTWDFYFKDNRPARSIIRLLGLFVQFMKKQFNITVKVIETDNEIVTVKQEVEKWCTSLSIKLEPSAPDTQAQNGGAERSGGVIKEKARAIRLDANLPWELWPETTRAAVYLYNRTPNYPNNWKTPYEIFYTHAAAMNGIVTGPRKPNQAHLKAYGCKAFAMTDDTHRGKSRLQRLDPKAWIGYLVGYQSTNIYRIWIPSMAKVISTRDVVFDEETIFNGKTEDLMDNLMHNTLEEIATWVRTVELPGTQSQQAETETFYEDDTTQEESPRTQKTRYHQGRKVVEAYLTPPPTPPPVALLVQGEVNNEDMTNMSNQSTSMTSPWAAAFMAGTESGHIGQHEGKSIDKAQVKRLLSKGIKPHRTGHRLQPAVLQAILDRIAACESDRAISRATGASRNTVAKLRLSLEFWGVPYPPRCVRLGRPSILRQAQREGLQAYLNGSPGAYMDEMRDFLYDEYDVRISLASVYRELEKMRWSRKLATKRAKEQSEPLRRLYLARMAQHYKAEQIVALDESACNERTGDRKYGWSPIGEPVELSHSFRRSERWSLLPAMTIDGYISYKIFQGAITSEILEDFLEFQVLPFCNPHPGPASVIVLDNASIHRSERVRVLCQSAGVLLEYLPPYSPDFNPIEKSFKQLKGWMKRNSAQAENFIDFGVFLEYAAQLVCCNINCRSWFHRCGYPY